MNNLDTLTKWFYEEKKWPNISGFAFLLILATLCSSLFFGFIISLVTTIPEQSKLGIPIASITFPFIILILAFIEELFFRFPLSLISKFCSFPVVISVAIILSIIFGYLHGGIPNIFIQGVGGFLFSILYLKCGGLQGKIIKPLFCSTCMHAILNLIICYSAFILQGTKYI